MSQLLRARRVLTKQGWLNDHQLCMAHGVITAIDPIPAGVTARDAELLCPAYIDTHVHGGAGVDVMDDAPDVLDTLALHKAREGVGAFLPTTVTAPLEAIHGALRRIARLLLSTRETVACETPASLAISLIVILFFFAMFTPCRRRL